VSAVVGIERQDDWPHQYPPLGQSQTTLTFGTVATKAAKEHEERPSGRGTSDGQSQKTNDGFGRESHCAAGAGD
jgi:hypothetical protein